MKRLVLAATALLFAFAAAPMARADEIDDAVAVFTADDGLTAAEKLPALKALIEVHKDNPKVEKLTAILKNLAAEAGEPVADGRDKRDPPAVKPAVVAGDQPTTAEPGRPRHVPRRVGDRRRIRADRPVSSLQMGPRQGRDAGGETVA